ncbi:hypothetical protein P691DRAFT_811523 [Macrolepiota fuliginosa MF-IS2]|uniref:Uncharacterized protein n=1 Tax=Macrolepiota fuliginosa MF-IS2 TaxID=1400762 RepID=A0A9P5X253_9AGAR|nr:hypothetical protein P691DRAFT_811523 [Macrolepiota fuliginosa MF-IS2]
MLSLFKSCIDVPRRRRKRREVPGHGGGGNLSTLAGLPSEATTNPDHLAGPPNNAKSQTPPADPLDNAPGGPGLPAGSSAGPPAGTPSTIMIDNPSLPNGSFANASYIVMNYPMMIDGDNSNEGRCTYFQHYFLFRS